ncbi:hypothetical protein ACHAWF_017795 [Thalassiosira exigua]
MASSDSDGFSGDPYLLHADPGALRDGRYEKREGDGSFGLPLVVAWRAFPTELESAYRVLASRLSACFAATTGFGNDPRAADPEAHIYPFGDLHITVATFRTLFDPAPTRERAERIKRLGAGVVERATKRDDWPRDNGEAKVKLRLRPKEVRLGEKNAITLWEEATGNLDAMRSCLKQEMEIMDSINGMAFSVPNIVHSTIMRFWKRQSDPERLKHLFKDRTLLDILPTQVEVVSNAIFSV